MPRRPRIGVPGQALHIIQRGHNRQPCFFAEDDDRYYLDSLNAAAARYGGRVHAYVLMTNHVPLLLTPECPETPSILLQSVGRRYVRCVNQVYRRSGTLWEGRYKLARIDSDRYLLTCSRISSAIRSAPGWSTIPVITAGPAIAAMPAERWSRSFRHTPYTWRWAIHPPRNAWHPAPCLSGISNHASLWRFGRRQKLVLFSEVIGSRGKWKQSCVVGSIASLMAEIERAKRFAGGRKGR